MSAIIAVCRRCGMDFEPDHDAILAGTWRTCLTCRPPTTPPPDDPGSRCESCGRPLRAGHRRMCLACLTGAAAL